MHSRITKRPASLLSLAAAMTATVGLATVQPALAQQAGTQMQSEARQHFDIPAGSMTAALNALARQTGLALTFDPDLTQGKTSQGLSGDYTVSEALRAILAGSGLSHRFTGPDSVILRPALRSDVVELSTVLVEGHRLNVYEEIHANEEKRLHSLRPDLILGSEQMQRFPDEHIGKALDRMPGMFSTSPAEKQEVRVRGSTRSSLASSWMGSTSPAAIAGATCRWVRWPPVLSMRFGSFATRLPTSSTTG